MVTKLGMSDRVGNIELDSTYRLLAESTKALVESEVRRFVEEGRGRATTLLKERRKELDLLAKALVEYEALSLEEMQKVLKGEKLQKMTALPGAGIKLPEIVLPPGLGGGSSAGPGAGGVSAPPATRGEEGGEGGAGGARL